MQRLILASLFMIMSLPLSALSTPLQQTVTRMIQQLNTLLPLMEEAERQTNPKAALQLHMTAFKGADGKQHLGLRDDILLIRRALIHYLEQAPKTREPITPLALDFIEEPP